MVEHGHEHENEVIAFAETNFRGQKRRFGMKTDDRRRHMYVLGKTGMGKSNLLENMIIRDIFAGHGVGVIDPHGELVEKILDFIPPDRINDVVYINPSDMEHPIGFNVLESVDEGHKHLIAAGLMGVFKKIWPDVWSARMEYIMQNCLLALMEYPGSTLMGINRLLTDKEYRSRVVAKIKDPVVKSFWVTEFAAYDPKFRTEAIAPIQNKVGQFLASAMMRNIVAQVKSTIDPRDIMDSGKILLMNLSKGRIGEDASRLLGGLLVTKLQLTAMERVDIPEADRRDFYLYVDEFQNFATESFANILSEARKYRLSLIMAHQYIEQLDEKVCAAVFGNVGTMVVFRIGGADAEFILKEFEPQFTETDLVNLPKFHVYLKLMIDGVSSQPFSATTLPPITERTNAAEKVIKVSRERWATPRAVIEEKIMRWSAPDEGDETKKTIIEERSPSVPFGSPRSGETSLPRSTSERAEVTPQRPLAEPLPKGKWATPMQSPERPIRRPDQDRFAGSRPMNRPRVDDARPEVSHPPRPTVRFQPDAPPSQHSKPPLSGFSLKDGRPQIKETTGSASLKGLMRKDDEEDEDEEASDNEQVTSDKRQATRNQTVFTDTPASKPKTLRPGEKAKL